MPLKPANENNSDPGDQEPATRAPTDLFDDLRRCCHRNAIGLMAFGLQPG